MVSLSEGLGRSLGAELSDIRGQLQAAWRAESPEAGMVEWVAHASGTILRFDVPPFVYDDVPVQRWSEAPILAAAGYRIGLPPVPPDVHERWLEGMTRLRSRDAVPADRNSFFFRPTELLGIAIGASALQVADPNPAKWLRGLIAKNGYHLQTANMWATVLTTLAARQVGSPSAEQRRIDPKTTIDVAALLSMYLIDVDLARSVSAPDLELLCHRLLLDASRTRIEAHGLAEAGILWIALERAVLAAIDGLDFLRMTRAADFVVTMCRRFPLLVADLGQRHAGRKPFELVDEFDVQDLFRALLRVHFDDVRPEEWNPSYGGVSSRSDLLIKSERIVIETKMTRKNLGQNEVIEELTVDKAQYRIHPDCGTLVCFVYDPAHRLSNPSALEADLSGVDADFTTKVVVSPRGL
jgi:hypothetical protein